MVVSANLVTIGDVSIVVIKDVDSIPGVGRIVISVIVVKNFVSGEVSDIFVVVVAGVAETISINGDVAVV